ncbi:hypothetical protein HMPREF9374_3513 [Desmospora sp. 8437]|nr:hypothetical protein HMPREF9374_3513 [Desmospora sp. 8437]
MFTYLSDDFADFTYSHTVHPGVHSFPTLNVILILYSLKGFGNTKLLFLMEEFYRNPSVQTQKTTSR